MYTSCLNLDFFESTLGFYSLCFDFPLQLHIWFEIWEVYCSLFERQSEGSQVYLSIIHVSRHALKNNSFLVCSLGWDKVEHLFQPLRIPSLHSSVCTVLCSFTDWSRWPGRIMARLWGVLNLPWLLTYAEQPVWAAWSTEPDWCKINC